MSEKPWGKDLLRTPDELTKAKGPDHGGEARGDTDDEEEEEAEEEQEWEDEENAISDDEPAPLLPPSPQKHRVENASAPSADAPLPTQPRKQHLSEMARGVANHNLSCFAATLLQLVFFRLPVVTDLVGGVLAELLHQATLPDAHLCTIFEPHVDTNGSSQDAFRMRNPQMNDPLEFLGRLVNAFQTSEGEFPRWAIPLAHSCVRKVTFKCCSFHTAAATTDVFLPLPRHPGGVRLVSDSMRIAQREFDGDHRCAECQSLIRDGLLAAAGCEKGQETHTQFTLLPQVLILVEDHRQRVRADGFSLTDASGRQATYTLTGFSLHTDSPAHHYAVTRADGSATWTTYNDASVCCGGSEASPLLSPQGRSGVQLLRYMKA
jgi:hypothetical protein